MAVTYIVKFNVIPDRRDRFLELLEGVLDAMREETTLPPIPLVPMRDDTLRKISALR